MNLAERQNEILELIKSGKCSSVKELCAQLYTSPATIRRDLRVLEKNGAVHLSYGNVILSSVEDLALPLTFRAAQSKESKRKIAQYAASLIEPNSSVLLDSSSTAMNIADFIPANLGISVFTNCIKTAVKLCENGVDVYVLGGKMDPKNYITRGAWSMDNIEAINVDYLFFSAQTLDSDGLISGVSEPGIHQKKLMIAHAKKQYFLCTSEKLGKRSTFTLCRSSEITGIIADTDVSFIPNTNGINVNGLHLHSAPQSPR
ncbi:MAG: DeoR/GlpR transcriptional regulator [Lachnospiraceae bacterium]|jgi:DeoR/GlpR family transcriptional regulator of sugar metabolism|nr:DeoR/GlpR transcriptional regulator [Lachnospiraceae bacterium]